MTPRLASGVLVSALVRRAQAEGGNAAMLARGDPDAGAIVVILAQRGVITAVLEHGHDLTGRAEWRAVKINPLISHDNVSAYIERRRIGDPDLWAVELDVADSERFAAEMYAAG